MADKIKFTLDGKTVITEPGETIWQVAKRVGTEIPHLCYAPEPGYRPDGNCRACMVEIEGERVLAASCIRKPNAGMKVVTASKRAKKAREMVFELLVADQPDRTKHHDDDSRFWQWAEDVGVDSSRFPKKEMPSADSSHPAMAVNLDACINCTLCVRACRDVQVNDVIGMAERGSKAKIVFDLDDPMGDSTCVACGECVQACPTGALLPKSVTSNKKPGRVKADRKVDSVCPYCGVGCQLTYHLKDEKLLYVTGREGPANENRLCVKGRFGFDYVHHPHRLNVPLIRRDGVPKNAFEDIDPSNPLTHFREASWEEAIERAAGGLRQIRERNGGGSLAGFGSAKGSNEEAYLFQKLVRTGFGTNNVDHCTRLCHASSVAALMECIGSGAVTAPFTAVRDAEVIMVIGANPTENHPVAATFFKQAVRDGKTLIVMDPRGQALKRHATHMLQFKPGADVSMLNAIMHVIIEENLYDEQYIQAHTDGFQQLKDHLAAFPPERMSEVCGISAETLRTVARTYAKSKASIIFWGMGISQHIHGTDNARCLIDLSLMTGQVGRPGTGLHPLRGQNNVQGASDAGLVPMFFPDYQLVTEKDIRSRFEEFWNTELDPERGLTVVEIMDEVHTGRIKGMYVMGENPAMSDPDAQHAREALSALEVLVVQDIFLTETAFHADVVLPASAWPEKDGTVTNTNRQVQMGRLALPLQGKTQQDWWIIQELARGMGLDWNYTHPREIFTEMAQIMPSMKNITWERVNRENAVTYPCDGPNVPGNEIVFGDGFPTISGRGKMVAADIVPPAELPDEEYPMVLTTGRQLEHWHTGAITRRASILDAIEPEAVVCLNTRDMRDMGVKPGEMVRVATRRGILELKARVDRAIPQGVIFIPFCYAEAPANFLTNPQLDPFGKIPEFKFCAARIESAKAAAAE
jgi:formate dehydrogenase major subunit